MNKTYELIIEKDQDIRMVIGDFVLEKRWKSAYISGAIGSVKDVWLTAPQTKEFPPKVGKVFVEGPGEMLAFTGEVMIRERMDPALKSIYTDESHPLFIHIHASLAVSGSHVYGGGFQDGTPFRSLKVFIQQSEE